MDVRHQIWFVQDKTDGSRPPVSFSWEKPKKKNFHVIYVLALK